MMALYSDGRAFDLSANAAAPFEAWAFDLIALPYRDRGRWPRSLDCMGVVEYALARRGAARAYGDLYRGVPHTERERIDALMRAEAAAWVDGEGAPGDVLAIGTGGCIHHVAVLCGGGRAVHASAKHGVLIEQAPARASRFGFGRIMGVGRPA